MKKDKHQPELPKVEAKTPAMDLDQPLTRPDDDVLGVRDLAKKIATSIANTPHKDGLVMGLYGAWGTGKTTFVNFIKDYLRVSETPTRVLMLDFNPWIFSGHEDLIQRFLIELSKKISPKSTAIDKKLKPVFENVEALTSIAADLAEFAISIGGGAIVANGIRAIRSLSKQGISELKKKAPLADQKEKIADKLRKLDGKIVVVIDDIDRLEANEILDIFRMVKAVADFPNIIYLLVFDRELVSLVIKDVQKSDGKNYLEKIVQYEIDLPHPNPAGVLKIFSARVDPVLEMPKGKSFDTDRWSEIYRTFFRRKIQTPRQATKLSNAIAFAYSGLVGEVDPVDLIGIELLRMLFPALYHEIRSNPERFTELGQNEFEPEKNDPPYFQRVLEILPVNEREMAKVLLSRLFPRFENAFSNFKTSVSSISEWRGAARACSAYHFHKYFSYTLTPDQFSDLELSEAVEASKDVSAFERLLLGYAKDIKPNGISRIPEFLERLLDHIQAGAADEFLEGITKGLLIFGDELIRPNDKDQKGFFGVETDARLLWVLRAAMERMPENEVFSVLKAALLSSRSIHTVIQLVYYLGREHGRYNSQPASIIRPGEQPYFTVSQVEELEASALKIIRAAAKKNTLLSNLRMSQILYRWNDFSGAVDEPKNWAAQITKTDDGLIEFLFKFSGIRTSYGKKITTARTMDIPSVATFLDAKFVADRVAGLLKANKVKGDRAETLRAYMTAYNVQQEGGASMVDND